MEFHQKPDAESGAQTHHVAPGDNALANRSTHKLREMLKNGEAQPFVRNALGVLDALLTKCHHIGDYKVFARSLPIEDATATRAALELIRRQTKHIGFALDNAEAELLEVLDGQTRPAGELFEDGAK